VIIHTKQQISFYCETL